jgi:hypothetical protein
MTVPAFMRIQMRNGHTYEVHEFVDVGIGGLGPASSRQHPFLMFIGMQGERLILRGDEISSLVVGHDVPEEVIGRVVLTAAGMEPVLA